LFSLDRTNEDWDELEKEWQSSLNQINFIVNKLNDTSLVDPNVFKKMCKLRNDLQIKLTSLVNEFKTIQQVQDKIDECKQKSTFLSADIEKYKNYVKNEEIEIDEEYDSGYYSTTCVKCKTICHDHCSLLETNIVGSNIFGCTCMNNNKCKVCSCGVSTHVHSRKQFRKIKNSVQKILEGEKKKFEKANKDFKNTSSDINNYNGDMQNCKNMVSKKKKEIEDECINLKKICKNFDFVEELYTVIVCLEMDKKNIKSSDVKKNYDDLIKSIKKLCEELNN
jgi:hypothetical protein